jgi:glycerol-3-phosphate acyltransferase PlsX
MLPVAVDALGGDKAPAEIVEGAKQAVAAGIPVLLVGPTDLADRGDLPLHVATEFIDMHEDPASSVRNKKDSTLVVSADLVRDGVASTPTVMLDAGANAEVEAEWMMQFAVMGSVYANARYGIERPRVGLLSIGEEPGKGDTLRKKSYELLSAMDNINFIGNVEGRDIMTPDVDVVVTDGFTGNVALKTLEGTMRTIVKELFASIGEPQYKEHTEALMPALLNLYSKFDPDSTGGAILLGVDGVCIISHGSSSARAMLNGIKVAKDMVECDMVGLIANALKSDA